MSEPIMEMIDDFVGSAMAGVDSDASIAKQHAAIEREVAALRERAERSSSLHIEVIRAGILLGEKEQRIADLEAENKRLKDNTAIVERERGEVIDRLVAEKADLEAERAALMAAAAAYLQDDEGISNDTFELAYSVLIGQPGALAAWLAREGR